MPSRKSRRPARRSLALSSCPEPPAPIITPALRQALAELLETDPHRFIKACVQAQITSLREIPAWCDLLAANPWRAREIAVLAEDAGLQHRQ